MAADETPERRPLGDVNTLLAPYAQALGRGVASVRRAPPLVEAAAAAIRANGAGVDAAVEATRSKWEAPVKRHLAEIAVERRRKTRLTWEYHARLVMLAVAILALSIAVFWRRHWRKLLIAAIAAVALWAAVTYGPAAWRFASSLFEDLRSDLGRLLGGGTASPASQPAPAAPPPSPGAP